MFSNWANHELQPGQSLEVMPPAGNFTVDFDPDNARHYVAFAVGSGITPVFSLVKSALSAEPRSRFTLFFGNRASSSVLFREEIEDLKNLYMERFSLVYIMSRESQDIELFNGRLDGDKVDQLLTAWMRPGDIDYAFVCGPQTMIESVVEHLQARGMPKSHIKFELFGAPKGRGRCAPDATRPPRPARASARSRSCRTATAVRFSSTRTRIACSIRRWRKASSCLIRARAGCVPPAAARSSQAKSTWTPTSPWKITKWRAVSCSAARATRLAVKIQ